jgi:hypothetical protein
VHTSLVYTGLMKNVTFSADEATLARARELARRRATTLNQMFRDWLAELTSARPRAERYDDLMRRLQSRRSGGRFSREGMNVR